MKPSDTIALLPQLRDAIRSGRVPRELRPALSEIVESWARTTGARIATAENARRVRSERTRAAVREAILHFTSERPGLSHRELKAMAARRAERTLIDTASVTKPRRPSPRTVNAVLSEIETEKRSVTFSPTSSAIPCNAGFNSTSITT